jgi:hypothetical protein
MANRGPALTMSRAVELLERDFGAALERTAIQAAMHKAMSDLSGSIAAEVLPEMAYRLTGYRLASQPAPADRLGIEQLVRTAGGGR